MGADRFVRFASHQDELAIGDHVATPSRPIELGGTIPEQQEIQKSQSDKIRALLTPAQQSEYDVVVKERRERMKKGGPRGGPGGF